MEVVTDKFSVVCNCNNNNHLLNSLSSNANIIIYSLIIIFATVQTQTYQNNLLQLLFSQQSSIRRMDFILVRQQQALNASSKFQRYPASVESTQHKNPHVHLSKYSSKDSHFSSHFNIHICSWQFFIQPDEQPVGKRCNKLKVICKI